MGRPPVPRRIGCRFGVRGFRPLGKPARGLPVVALGLDELEALRLADLEGLYQEEAAARMRVSRATFGRILAAAHSKVARAIVEGAVLLVDGEAAGGEAGSRMVCPRHGGGGGVRRCTCGTAVAGRSRENSTGGGT